MGHNREERARQTGSGPAKMTESSWKLKLHRNEQCKREEEDKGEKTLLDSRTEDGETQKIQDARGLVQKI